MKYNIPCELIQDLLPLFVDGLTSEVTSQEIKAHLEGCEACRERWERMERQIEGESRTKREEEEREIDYLKKVRKNSRRRLLTGALAALLIVAAAAFVKLFVIGYPVDSYYITYTNVNDKTINFGGVFYDSAAVYSRYKLAREADGPDRLVVYACLPSPWNRSGVFNLEMDLPETGKGVDIGGIVIKSDGTVISKLAGQLFQARNPYIGDASADGRLAGALGVGTLGAYTNELQTSQEPYGWKLLFEDGVSNSAVFEERMKQYACVLIALTGNLGEMSWSYTVETESGPMERESKMTEADCDQYLGRPVKSFAASPEKVQELLDLLDIGK